MISGTSDIGPHRTTFHLETPYALNGPLISFVGHQELGVHVIDTMLGLASTLMTSHTQCLPFRHLSDLCMSLDASRSP